MKDELLEAARAEFGTYDPPSPISHEDIAIFARQHAAVEVRRRELEIVKELKVCLAIGGHLRIARVENYIERLAQGEE